MAVLSIASIIGAILVLSTLTLSQERDGVIGLWSDSECNSKGTTFHFSEPDPLALNFDLDPDTCGVPFNTVRSYKIRKNAVCNNGTSARFVHYESTNCTKPPTDEDPGMRSLRRQRGTTFTTTDDLVGECLALIAFNSFTFECDGVSRRGKKVPRPDGGSDGDPDAGSGDASSSSVTASSPPSTASSSSSASSSSPTSLESASASASASQAAASTTDQAAASLTSPAAPSPTPASGQGAHARIVSTYTGLPLVLVAAFALF